MIRPISLIVGSVLGGVAKMSEAFPSHIPFANSFTVPFILVISNGRMFYVASLGYHLLRTVVA